MKYIPEDQTCRFSFTAQDANGAASFTADGTNPIYCIKQSDGTIISNLVWASITDNTATIAGGYTAVIDTSHSDFTVDQQYDVVVKGTIGGDTFTAKVGEFTSTALADVSQVEELDLATWYGTVQAGTLTTTSFTCKIYDGDGNELSTDAGADLGAQQQLKNRTVHFKGDQTGALRGQTAQIASYSGPSSDVIILTIQSDEALSTAPVVNDTFLISAF